MRGCNMVRKPEDARSIEDRYIADVHYLYQLAITENSAGQMALSAFDALLFVGGYWLFDSPQKKADPNWEPEAESLVTVPLWVVNSLAQAWIAYRDAPSGKTFGEVLGIEGGGQGKRRAKEAWMNKNRDLRLALAVHQIRVEAQERGQQLSLEKAYASVAASTGTSEDIVRHAWRQHGRKLTESRGA